MRILRKISFTILLCLYLVILTKLILFKDIPITEIFSRFPFYNNDFRWRSNNFIPFKTINFYLYIADVNLSIRIENLVGNVIGFAPLGFILPLLSNRFQKFFIVTLAAFCLSLTFELLQLVLEVGSFDVDDLILNTLGAILGFILIKFILLIRNAKKRCLLKRTQNK